MRAVVVGLAGFAALALGAVTLSIGSPDVAHAPWQESTNARAGRVAAAALAVGKEIATYYVDSDTPLEIADRPSEGVSLTSVEDSPRRTLNVALDRQPDVRLVVEGTHATSDDDWCVAFTSAGHPESTRHYAFDHGPGSGPCPARG